MGCCNGNSWKREEKTDHRFDFIEIKDFHTNSFGCRIAHMFVWFSTFRSFAILGLDIYTAVGLLLLKSYTTTVAQQTFIAHDITKWIFAGCIILSIVLLIWDWFVALRIIKSKNISFAFTNLIANRLYSLRSYDHHCLFYKLESSSHKSNKVAFWVFFSFIGWKRLLLSEGPRQAINALTVFSVLSTRNFSFDPAAYKNITMFQWTVLGFMSLSLLIWLFSFARFVIAAVAFLPLLCHLQGGLTEFVVRKIDKRIERIIEKARKKRLERYARARAESRDSKSSSKKSLHRTKSLIKESPTLPDLTSPDEKFIGYAETSSLYSQSSYASERPSLPRSETLPAYRSNQDLHALSVQQQEPTLPNLSTSPPRRPVVRPVPSYHRQESYGRQQRVPSGPRQMTQPRPHHPQQRPHHPQHRPQYPQQRPHHQPHSQPQPQPRPSRFGDTSPFPPITRP